MLTLARKKRPVFLPQLLQVRTTHKINYGIAVTNVFRSESHSINSKALKQLHKNSNTDLLKTEIQIMYNIHTVKFNANRLNVATHSTSSADLAPYTSPSVTVSNSMARLMTVETQ